MPDNASEPVMKGAQVCPINPSKTVHLNRTPLEVSTPAGALYLIPRLARYDLLSTVSNNVQGACRTQLCNAVLTLVPHKSHMYMPAAL
jgi:hypothetical protein